MSSSAVSESLFDQYVPPKFFEDKSIIIPQEYLTKKHRLEPLDKGKSYLVEKYRGHHLWKG